MINRLWLALPSWVHVVVGIGVLNALWFGIATWTMGGSAGMRRTQYIHQVNRERAAAKQLVELVSRVDDEVPANDADGVRNLLRQNYRNTLADVRAKMRQIESEMAKHGERPPEEAFPEVQEEQ